MLLKECFHYRAETLGQAIKYCTPLMICGRTVWIIKPAAQEKYWICRLDPMGLIAVPAVSSQILIRTDADGFTAPHGVINIEAGLLRLEQ